MPYADPVKRAEYLKTYMAKRRKEIRSDPVRYAEYKKRNSANERAYAAKFGWDKYSPEKYQRIKSDPKRSKLLSERSVRYRTKNKAVINAKGRAKYAKIKESPELYFRYLEGKKRLRSSPHEKVLRSCRSRLNDFASRQVCPERTMQICGIDLNGLMRHLESKWKPGMSWQNHGKFGWHIDHIKPCSSFDLSIEDDVKKCFNYNNLQPLWWNENLSKGDKYSEND